jgi:hypothetical protein
LEAIALTESLLATRLESRLTWVRRWKGDSEVTEFDTVGHLCTELLGKKARVAPDWKDFQESIEAISDWTDLRNGALHEMAKLVKEDGQDFNEEYEKCRRIALEGFRVLLAYDRVDRDKRREAKKSTATDNLKGATAFDCLRNIAAQTGPVAAASRRSRRRPRC